MVKETQHAFRWVTGDCLADRRGHRGRPTRVLHPRFINCASAGTIALTVIAGPLNYFGVNPKVTNCNVPQPSG
jgi:hypothetical protein